MDKTCELKLGKTCQVHDDYDVLVKFNVVLFRALLTHLLEGTCEEAKHTEHVVVAAESCGHTDHHHGPLTAITRSQATQSYVIQLHRYVILNKNP